jgi:hypothetical protein
MHVTGIKINEDRVAEELAGTITQLAGGQVKSADCLLAFFISKQLTF